MEINYTDSNGEKVKVKGGKTFKVKKYKKTVLLYSGGQDSFITAALNKEKIDTLLYIDNHSRYSAQEYQRLRVPEGMEGKLLIDRDFFNMGDIEQKDATIPLRNLYFLAYAACFGDRIWIGAVHMTTMLDKSPTFLKRMSKLLTYLYQEQFWTVKRKIIVEAPYINKTKTELLREFFATASVADRDRYFGILSCYDPTEDGKACGECKSCVRKMVSEVNVGIWEQTKHQYANKSIISTERFRRWLQFHKKWSWLYNITYPFKFPRYRGREDDAFEECCKKIAPHLLRADYGRDD